MKSFLSYVSDVDVVLFLTLSFVLLALFVRYVASPFFRALTNLEVKRQIDTTISLNSKFDVCSDDSTSSKPTSPTSMLDTNAPNGSLYVSSHICPFSYAPQDRDDQTESTDDDIEVTVEDPTSDPSSPSVPQGHQKPFLAIMSPYPHGPRGQQDLNHKSYLLLDQLQQDLYIMAKSKSKRGEQELSICDLAVEAIQARLDRNDFDPTLPPTWLDRVIDQICEWEAYHDGSKLESKPQGNPANTPPSTVTTPPTTPSSATPPSTTPPAAEAPSTPTSTTRSKKPYEPPEIATSPITATARTLEALCELFANGTTTKLVNLRGHGSLCEDTVRKQVMYALRDALHICTSSEFVLSPTFTGPLADDRVRDLVINLIGKVKVILVDVLWGPHLYEDQEDKLTPKFIRQRVLTEIGVLLALGTRKRIHTNDLLLDDKCFRAEASGQIETIIDTLLKYDWQ